MMSNSFRFILGIQNFSLNRTFRPKNCRNIQKKNIYFYFEKKNQKKNIRFIFLSKRLSLSNSLFIFSFRKHKKKHFFEKKIMKKIILFVSHILIVWVIRKLSHDVVKKYNNWTKFFFYFSLLIFYENNKQFFLGFCFLTNH